MLIKGVENDLNLLQDVVREKCIALEVLLANEPLFKKYELEMKRRETGRQLIRQKAYFAQGRETIEVVNKLRAEAGLDPLHPSDNTYTITKCDGIKFRSKHQDKRAADYSFWKNGVEIWAGVPKVCWERFGELAVKTGFGWGGNWGKTATALGWDCPHIEI